MTLIHEAVENGARLKPSCAILGLSERTLQRWKIDKHGEDRRCGPRHAPINGLSQQEQSRVVSTLQSPVYRNLPPAQIVARLADEGHYIASESTMYRLLRQHEQVRRREVNRPRLARAPRHHVATGPNQVWCWDITLLPSTIRGHFFYLYLVVDLFSRRIMGIEIRSEQSATTASTLIRRLCDEYDVDGTKLVLHSDNGSPMKGATMLETLRWLGITPSFSRPHVSDDNAYVEALFRTLKYRPATPSRFDDCSQAAVWAEQFMHWYNTEHRHSGIRYVTPDERYAGKDMEVLKARHALYLKARAQHPRRWTGQTRNWSRPQEVFLNYSKDEKSAYAA